MHTAAHPGVSETLKLDYTHTEALIEMLFVLWDYGIPSISFTLLPGHGSLQAMMGEWWHGIQMQNPLCDFDVCRPHPPLLARLFCQPSMSRALLTL